MTNPESKAAAILAYSAVYQMPQGDWAAAASWPCTISDGFSTEIDAWKWIVQHYERALNDQI